MSVRVSVEGSGCSWMAVAGGPTETSPPRFVAGRAMRGEESRWVGDDSKRGCDWFGRPGIGPGCRWQGHSAVDRKLVVGIVAG